MCSVNKAYFSLFPILIHTFSSQQTVLFVALLKVQLVFSVPSHPCLPVNLYFAGRSMTEGAKSVSTWLTWIICLLLIVLKSI